MRPLLVGCALLLGALAVLAHSPSLWVNAQEKPAAAQPSSRPPAKVSPQASSAIDPQKEARIRELIEVTGAKNLGQQLIEAGMEQFRSSVQDSQPNNPRAKQFADAFVARFQKHFDPDSLTEHVIPIYDKYLTTEDLKGLLDYYRSPLGQRMLKALPECMVRRFAASEMWDVTSWSALMYTAFVGVNHSWPGWNALRSFPH